MSDEQQDPAGHDETVGSLTQEAVRLAAAIASWTTQHGADLGHHAHEAAGFVKDQVRDGVREFDEHFGTDSAECRYCPVCRAVASVRDVSPEVKAHLASAATSLVAAASGFLATVVDETRTASRTGQGRASGGSGQGDADGAEEGTPSPRSAPQKVQRIDLDDE